MHGPLVFGGLPVHQVAAFEHQPARVLRVDHPCSLQSTVFSKTVTGSHVGLDTLLF